MAVTLLSHALAKMSLTPRAIDPRNLVPLNAKMNFIANRVFAGVPAEAAVDHSLALAKQLIDQPAPPYMDNKSQIDQSFLASLKKSSKMVSNKDYNLQYKLSAHSTMSNPMFDKEGHYNYNLKRGTSPTRGLESFLKGPTETDCGGAAEALYIKAINDVIGAERFDALHSHPSFQLSLRTGGAYSARSLLHLFTVPLHTDCASSDRSHITLGSRVYFQGIPWYEIKHPSKHGMGYHAICVDKTETGVPLFWAFGFTKPMTEDEINLDLLNDFNEPQSEDDKKLLAQFKDEDEFFQFLKQNYGQKLKGFEQEMHHTYVDPNHLMTMEEAKEAGLGFFGYLTADKIHTGNLSILNITPISEITKPAFLKTLAIFQMMHLATMALKMPPQQLHKNSSQAKNFAKYV